MSGLVASMAALATVTTVAMLGTTSGSAAPSRAAGPTPADTLRDEAARRLAQIDGTIQVPGLDSAVEVRRDRWGVPHIYARTEHDLFFAQGYVAAQDRLWQMEMWRRTAEGRLAEVLGARAVERDRLARLFRYRGSSDAEWAAYGPGAKAIVTAFVGGVNAYIAQVKDRPPIEFTMMGFAPEPWTTDVPLARVTTLSGVSNATNEILRARLISLLGKKATEDILPTEPTRALDPVPGLDLSGLDQSSLGGSSSAYADIAFQRVEGSNNWVVSGKKTRSGKPILANDPHRAITHPSVRYITHLVGPGWNVIGAGEPASPGVSIGHNERIAFGLTIVGMDQQDVYVERIGACPGGGRREAGSGTARSAQPEATASRCYYHNGGWQPIKTITDTIRVKGEPPRIVRLEFTHHGPVVSSDSARARGRHPNGRSGAGHRRVPRLATARARAQLARVPECHGEMADAEREHDLRRRRRKHRLDRRRPHAAPQLVRAPARSGRRTIRVGRLRAGERAAAVVQPRERVHRDREQQHSPAGLQDADRVRLVVRLPRHAYSRSAREPERFHRRRFPGAAAR
jgi:acyl-homoserine lactone acylase PvdQ